MSLEPINYNAVFSKLEKMINDLKIEYENYFMGISKREPINLKQEVERIIRKMSAHSLGKTSRNFKFKQLSARFRTYDQYWMRTVRKIEDGTYGRDRFKMALKDKSSIQSQAPARSGANEEAHYKKLYSDLINAKLKCNEKISGLPFDKFKRLLKKQSADLKAKYNCNSVDFRVTIADGKTKIKVVPK